MKNIISPNFQEDVGNNSYEFFGSNPKNKGIKKLSSIQFNLTPNYKILNTENSSIFQNLNSPLKTKRINSLQFNLNNINELKETFDLNANNNNTNNINTLNSTREEQKDKKIIKTKFKNQSELRVSLNFMRGKSLKLTDQTNALAEKSKKFKSNINNFSCTAATLGFSESPFSKFFKKPLTFRVSEFEEMNQIENNEKDKKNNTYAQQRFFSNTFSDNTTNIESNPNFFSENFLSPKFLKNKISVTDDIEKVMLINNREELVKTYVLPEIKYLSTQERKALCKYDVNDNSEKIIINKGNGIFLADILKKADKTIQNFSTFRSSSNWKSPETLSYDPRSIVVNVSDTKFGTFPKFLRKMSNFVRKGESKKIIENEENKNESFNKNIILKKLNFLNSINSNSNLSNVHNNINSINHTEESLNFNSYQNAKGSSTSINRNINNDNALIFNNEKNKLISKTSVNGFNFNSNNLKDLNNINQNSNIINPGKINNLNNFTNTNSKKNISFYNTKFSNTNVNFTSNNKLNTVYISDKGYEIDLNRYVITNNKKNTRDVHMDYPEVKFPVQPYKKFQSKKLVNNNYLTNGSMINNTKMIKNIKILNENIAENFKNDKKLSMTDQMSNNIDKLNIIEKNINKLIESSKVTMKDNKEYRRFNSNNSIIVLK